MIWNIQIAVLAFFATVVCKQHDEPACDPLCVKLVKVYESMCPGRIERSGPVIEENPPKRGTQVPNRDMGLNGSKSEPDYDRVEEIITQNIREVLDMYKRNSTRIYTMLSEINKRIDGLESISVPDKLQQHRQEEVYEGTSPPSTNHERPAEANVELNPQTPYIHLCDRVNVSNAQVWNTTGGVFNLQYKGRAFNAYCDLGTDGQPWLVFQRRMDGSENFYRGWNDYANGFGDPSREHWLGLETIHNLTIGTPHELRIELEDWEGNKRYAKYSTFRIGDARSFYALTLAGYSGDAGESIINYSNGMKFTTIDQDNDRYPGRNCAVWFKGAWWHNACHESNLNGQYLKGTHSTFADGIEWRAWKGYYYSLKFTEMKIRPTNINVNA